MDRTDRVRITGPGTDLRFSIKGIGADRLLRATATSPTASASPAP